MRVGEFVRKRREEQGISLRQLSKLTDLSENRLFRLEHGRTNLYVFEVDRLTQGLYLTVSGIVMTVETYDTGTVSYVNRMLYQRLKEIMETLMERISLKQVETSEQIYCVLKSFLLNLFYKDMEPESKLVYDILKDWLELFIRNNRVNGNGYVYLNFSIKLSKELLGFSNRKISAIKKELKQFGLVEAERQGLNKSNRFVICKIVSFLYLDYGYQTLYQK